MGGRPYRGRMQPSDPAAVVQQIAVDPAFRAGLAALAADSGQPAERAREHADRCLRELVAAHDDRAIGLFDRLGGWFARAYGVEVDRSRLDELHALNRTHPLVFLPAHKSYLDPIVAQAVLAGNDFPPTHLLGGINLSFWPIGPLARRTGVIYIRRTFADDAIYKFCVRSYLRHLVDRRQNLEWYLEGGRSRTGKLRPPRLGLLAYLADAVRDSAVEDVYLVPVSIAYDQLHEVATMAAEQRGGRKRPEGLRWLLRYGRVQGTGLGSAHVRFGEPLSLRHGLAAGRLAVEKLAFEVSHRINQVTPITGTSLVALALLGMKGRALSVRELCAILDPLLDYVAVRKFPTAGTWEFATESDVARTLRDLVASGVVIRYAEGVEPVYAVHPQRDLEAAFYRNTVVHHFVNRAITELVVAGAALRHDRSGSSDSPPAADRPGSTDAAWADALALRDLLKFEFFFGTKREFAEQLREELAIVDPDWERSEGDPAAALAALRGLSLHLAHRVLRSFLEAYRVVADQLALRPPGLAVDADAFVAGCVPVARQYHLQQRVHSSESISQELFRTALRLAGNRDLLGPGEAGLTRRRAEFAAELREALQRVERISELALRRTEAALP